MNWQNEAHGLLETTLPTSSTGVDNSASRLNVFSKLNNSVLINRIHSFIHSYSFINTLQTKIFVGLLLKPAAALPRDCDVTDALIEVCVRKLNVFIFHNNSDVKITIYIYRPEGNVRDDLNMD